MAAGWWRSPDNAATFLLCSPESACTGGTDNTCLEGYGGRACGQCVSSGKHKYFRLGDECKSKLNFLLKNYIKLFKNNIYI